MDLPESEPLKAEEAGSSPMDKEVKEGLKEKDKEASPKDKTSGPMTTTVEPKSIKLVKPF